MEDQLIKTAMNIILYAGDAKGYIHETLKHLKEKGFEEAQVSIKEAEKNLVASHKLQTEIIQSACAGSHYEYNLLFSHAMDTLMTVQSEFELVRDLIPIFQQMQGG